MLAPHVDVACACCSLCHSHLLHHACTTEHLCLILFLSAVLGPVSCRSGKQVVDTVKSKLKPTLLANWTVWPVAHVINFALVPPAQRILYINVVNVSCPCRGPPCMLPNGLLSSVLCGVSLCQPSCLSCPVRSVCLLPYQVATCLASSPAG